MQLRKIGSSDLAISPIGLGCWQFSEGRSITSSYWPKLSPDITEGIVQASLSGHINWFDTAEVYGWGKSEAGLSRSLHALNVNPDNVIIATKWFPFLRFSRSIIRTVEKRLLHLNGYPIDLFQIHHPLGSFSSHTSQLDAMAELVKAGKIRTIGLSNFNAQQMRRAHDYLAKQNIPLVSNQMKYNLLERDIERNGILDTAKQLGITIIAYSPLAQGILSGKFHKNPDLIKSRIGPRKKQKQFSREGLAQSQDLVELLKKIGEKYDKSPAQVALNWLIHRHGETVVAIPGATKAEHARSNAEAMNFQLSEEEMERIGNIKKR